MMDYNDYVKLGQFEAAKFLRTQIKINNVMANKMARITADEIRDGDTLCLTEVKALELSVAMWRFMASSYAAPKRTFANKYQDHAEKAYGELGPDDCWLCKYDDQMQAIKRTANPRKGLQGCTFCPYFIMLECKCYASGTRFTEWANAEGRAQSKAAARKVLDEMKELLKRTKEEN